MVRFPPRFEDLFGDGWPSSLVRQWSVEEANSRNVISDHVREIVPSSVPPSEDKIGGRIGNGWKRWPVTGNRNGNSW